MGFFLRCLDQRHSLVHITYDANGKYDGLGAQAQRIIALRGMATFFQWSYRHSGAVDIAVHPLDGLKDQIDYQKYLNDVNYVFHFKSDCECNVYKEIHIIDFKLIHFITIGKYLLLRQRILLRITHPYSVVDTFPQIYQQVNLSSVRKRLYALHKDLKRFSVGLHHRQGSGDPEKDDLNRFVAVDRYARVLGKIGRHTQVDMVDFAVVTDAPRDFLYFYPPLSQIDSWIGLPGFNGKYLEMHPYNLDSFFDELQLNPVLFSGGNPLRSMALLGAAQNIIGGKSSFSYVVCLISQEATVYFPEDFWHPLMISWEKY